MAWSWRAYQMLLLKHPWKVQILTAGALVGCSDIVSQQVIERRGLANHDTKRTIKMATVGFIYVGPVLGVWYRVLDRLIVGQSKTVAFKKMLLDQFALAPCFLACFIVVTSFLGGHSPEEVWLKLKMDYKPTMISNYYIWPAVQMLNFYFIPLVHRFVGGQRHSITPLVLPWTSHWKMCKNSLGTALVEVGSYSDCCSDVEYLPLMDGKQSLIDLSE
ncbi:protein Mpv17 isoform X2 [Heterodontus francisci]|uniref:protein Mpv17 isoform X2 n=1 Tax=Heterodontus francisci TaxID=7792 RepID=UPI00355B382D